MTHGRLRAAWTGEFIAGVTMPLLVVPTAFNSGVNLLYLLGSMLLGYMVVAVAQGLLNMRSVYAELEDLPALDEDQELRLPARVANRGRFAAYALQVRPDLDGLVLEPGRLDTLAGGREERTFATCARPRRGLYPLASWVVESPFPIGFMRTQRRTRLPAARIRELAVLPRILAVDFTAAFGTDQTMEGDDILQHGQQGGSAFYGVRGYVYGDPLKHMHWKASAKVGKPMVREFHRPLQARYYLLLDLDASQLEGAGADANLEYLIRLAASLGRHLAAAHASYQFVWFDEASGATRVSEPFGRGGDLDQARRVLAGLAYTPASRLQTMLAEAYPTLPSGSRLVFFVPRDPATIPDEAGGLGLPTKAIFLVATGGAAPAPSRPPAGETGLARGVDLYRYSIRDDRLDHELA